MLKLRRKHELKGSRTVLGEVWCEIPLAYSIMCITFRNS